MEENYFYSSLSGQEIEDTLVGAVRFNAMQGLTTSQKAQARQNIGAGEENTQIKIKGFYDTLADLQQAIPVGNEGDVYAVGTESPYDLYIWDAVNIRWVNNGPISFSDAIIDDNDVSTTSVWSSAKVKNELAAQKTEIDADIDAVTQSVETVAVSLATYVRPNLLDNWYFGAGFPVNQRGQSSYSGASAYCVDRWFRRNDNSSNIATVTITDDGLQLAFALGRGEAKALNQPQEYTKLLGKTVTISALFKDVDAGSTLFLQLVASNGRGLNTSQIGGVLVTGNGLFTATFDMPATIGNYSYVNFGLFCGGEFDGKLVAAKLEIGATQTLAHQENGTWVLNEIPTYGAELAKCQRYYLVCASYIRYRAQFIYSGVIDFSIPTPVTMAGTPTLINGSAIDLSGWPSGGDGTGFTYAVQKLGYNVVVIRATKAGHTLNDAFIVAGQDFALSCDL